MENSRFVHGLEVLNLGSINDSNSLFCWKGGHYLLFSFLKKTRNLKKLDLP